MWARVLLLVVLVIGTLGAAFYLFKIDPYEENLFGRCQFLERTGYFCPGCGGTRAMHELLHLNVGRALSLNLMVFVALGLFLVLANVIAKELIGPKYPLPSVKITTWLGWTLGVVVLLFWGLRNIPEWPFSLLAP